MEGENGKYIGINLATDNEETSKVTISFKDANPELAASLREFAQLLTVSREFQYEGIEFVNGRPDIKGTAKLGILVDLTKNLENSEEKSSDYVTAIAAMLAYSLEDGEQKEALINAIVDYENNIYAGALEDEIDNISVGEFINAIKAAKAATEAGITFTEILDSLGLRNLLLDAPSVVAVYEPVLEVVYNLVGAAEKAIDVTENNRSGVTDENGKMVADVTNRSKISPVQSAEIALNDAIAQVEGLNSAEELTYLIGTGYGRNKVPFADENISEISCHAMGVHVTNPEVKAIIDIGGQDVKGISIDTDGTVKNYPYDKPYYIILNLAWGGDWGGMMGVDESCLPATYEIDYVRVFQKK